MSRNLCSTGCSWCCCDEVEKVGPDHQITPEEAGRYFSEYQGMVVADAECHVCGAKYLAWVDESKRLKYSNDRWNGDAGFHNLSYRSSFNDEPGNSDRGFSKPREVLRSIISIRADLEALLPAASFQLGICPILTLAEKSAARAVVERLEREKEE